MQASEFLIWISCIPLQLMLFALTVEMSVAQVLKLHLSFMKVSVAVVAGAGWSHSSALRWMLLRSFTVFFSNRLKSIFVIPLPQMSGNCRRLCVLAPPFV